MYERIKSRQKQKSKSQNQQKQSKQNHIKIWSYNLFLRPPPIKNNNDDYKSQRFALILQKLQMYDIICFQELFQIGSFRSEEMIAEGIRKGFYYWANSDPISFFGPIPVDSGLLVMSRFPIVYSKFYSFGLGVFSDSSSDKGYIYCKIDINGDTLHLFNLHLQASYLTAQKSSYHKEVSLAARSYQSKLLKKQISKLIQAEYEQKDLILLIGDFNINAHNQRQVLAKTSFIKAFIPEEFHQYQEFLAMMEGKDGQFILKKPYRMKDLVFQNYGYHPATYGEEALMVLTHKDQYGIPQRLDYIFQIEQIDCETSLTPIIETCLIEKSLVEGQPFTQLSDHYGINFTVKQKNSK